MTTTDQAVSTGEAVTAVIAERVRSLRKSRGMSQANLAEALNKVGVPWKRATVVNLEARAAGSRGRSPSGRDSVSVGELLGLAEVLGVPAGRVGPRVGLGTAKRLALADRPYDTGRTSQPDQHAQLSNASRQPMNPQSSGSPGTGIR